MEEFNKENNDYVDCVEKAKKLYTRYESSTSVSLLKKEDFNIDNDGHIVSMNSITLSALRCSFIKRGEHVIYAIKSFLKRNKEFAHISSCFMLRLKKIHNDDITEYLDDLYFDLHTEQGLGRALVTCNEILVFKYYDCDSIFVLDPLHRDCVIEFSEYMNELSSLNWCTEKDFRYDAFSIGIDNATFCGYDDEEKLKLIKCVNNVLGEPQCLAFGVESGEDYKGPELTGSDFWYSMDDLTPFEVDMHVGMSDLAYKGQINYLVNADVREIIRKKYCSANNISEETFNSLSVDDICFMTLDMFNDDAVWSLVSNYAV